jgi:hypothetical protein
MAQHDPRLAVAGQPRRFDEARLAPHIGLGAGDAGIEREVDDGGGDHDVDHLVAQRRHDAHGEHEQGEGHDGVGEAADDAVGPAAEIARGHARQCAQHEGQDDRGEGDREIEPGRHQHAAEDVAAELVRAEPVRGRRRLQRHRGVALQRAVGRQRRAQDRRQQEHREQAEGQPRHRVLRQDVAGVAQQRQHR